MYFGFQALSTLAFNKNSLTDQEVPSVNSRNGGVRISTHHVGPCRAAEPHAVIGHIGRMYETFSHGRSRTLGVQEFSLAIAAYHR